MALTLEALLAPVEGDDPAGPDLYDDPARHEIRRAFERSESIDMATGEARTAPTDWRAVIGSIEAQSALTKDLSLAVYLARGGARSGQLALVELGAAYLAGLVETMWDGVHPKLEEVGFLGRKSVCESLTKIPDFLEPLRQIPIVEHPRLGRFTGAQFEARNKGEGAEYAADFDAAVAEAGPSTLGAAVDHFDAITAALRRVDTVLTDKAEGDTGTDFRPTYTALKTLRDAVAAFAPGAGADEAPPPNEIGNPPADGRPPPLRGPSLPAGAVASREDVLRALDAVVAYYQRAEPASPVPLLLERARELVNADFLAILGDLVPGSLEEARRLLTSQRKRDEGY